MQSVQTYQGITTLITHCSHQVTPREFHEASAAWYAARLFLVMWICYDQCSQTSRFQRGAKGIKKNKDYMYVILKIKLGLGGALLSGREAGLKSKTPNLLFIYISSSD